MSTPVFEGSCVALVTPFRNGHVDWDKFRELIDWHIEKGTDALLIAGTTGETSTLTDSEHLELLRTAGMYIDRRVPFIAGTGSNDTAYSIMLSQYAEKHGADAVLIINPYYNKSTQKGIIAHVKAIAESIDIPVIVYNVPSRTGANITVDTLVELSKIPNVSGVKEASGSADRVSRILSVCDITVLSGDDALTLPMMSVGAAGVISVASNVAPRAVADLVHAAAAGRWDEARQMHYRYYSLFNDVFIETNPIPVKAAAEMVGLGPAVYRLPLCEMAEANREKLLATLRKCGLVK